jgi:hypothetical protein
MAAAKIAPSMLSSDFANLASEAERMLRLGADWLHMDIMVRSPSPLRPFLSLTDLFGAGHRSEQVFPGRVEFAVVVFLGPGYNPVRNGKDRIDRLMTNAVGLITTGIRLYAPLWHLE